MNENEMITISGSIEDIVYQNSESGFTVLSLENDFDQTTVVGELFGVNVGEELEVTGHYTTHPTFGLQFKAAVWTKKLPVTAGAILKFLSSGAIKGIGPITARRMVEEFGDKTLEIAFREPELLTKIKGISAGKARDISAEFGKMFSLRETIAALASLGVGTQEAIMAYKMFGEQTIDLVKDNPYMLCDSAIGIEFPKAEAIAVQLGISSDAPCRIRAGILHGLYYNLNNGHTCLPKPKLLSICTGLLELGEDRIEAETDRMIEEGELHRETLSEKEYVYLGWVHDSQVFIAARLSQIQLFGADKGKNIDKLIDMQEELQGIRYAALQRKAIEASLTSGVLILTGGPGTGKTTTINGIIRVLEQEGYQIALTAPTGRAAKRLSEVTEREAKTIHRLLETAVENNVHRFLKNEKNPLKADVVIVDEVSMVDTYLMESLLRAMKPTCRIILVGDSDQLPSVGAGNILGDLIECGAFTVVSLSEIFRQAAQSMIVVGAHNIVSGEMPVLNRRNSDFFFLQADLSESVALILDLCASRLPNTYGFSPIWDIQVLSPGKKGEIGTENLNRQLQMRLNPPSGTKKEVSFFGSVFREGDKVMQVKNNYDLIWNRQEERGSGIFNGDIGIIESIDRMTGVMKVLFDDRKCDYPMTMLSELELAYAVTVHKSQGSEFEAVVIPIASSGGKLYYRNLLYTAVTRAKKLLIIVGQAKGIAQMVQNDKRTHRYTLLKTMIKKEIFVPKNDRI